MINCFKTTPLFERDDKFTELRTVVAEVVDPHRLIAEEIQNTVQRAAQNRRGQMPDMEGLGDIDGGIVDTYSFAAADIIRTVTFTRR